LLPEKVTDHPDATPLVVRGVPDELVGDESVMLYD
jgi:hypothetical protein